MATHCNFADIWKISNFILILSNIDQPSERKSVKQRKIKVWPYLWVILLFGGCDTIPLHSTDGRWGMVMAAETGQAGNSTVPVVFSSC